MAETIMCLISSIQQQQPEDGLFIQQSFRCWRHVVVVVVDIMVATTT
jgi:hypothetical protein